MRARLRRPTEHVEHRGVYNLCAAVDENGKGVPVAERGDEEDERDGEDEGVGGDLDMMFFGCSYK